MTFWARNQHYGIPLIVLDWDLVQFDGDILNVWLKNIIAELERMARVCGARRGSVGVFIEDKQTGTILIQQAARQSPPWPVRAIDSDLTAQGKDERAISVLNYAYRGDIKISDVAHSKIVVFKENSRNHWESQVFGFKVGAKDGQADDLLDTFTYGAAISLGDSEGH